MKLSVLLMDPVPAVKADQGGTGGDGVVTKAPANMTTAQLGAMLSKPSTPDKQAKAGAATAAAAGKSGRTPGEGASAQDEPDPDKRQTDHSQTVSEPGEGEEGTEENETAGQGEGETAEGAEGEGAEDGKTGEGENETADDQAPEGAGEGEAKPALPAELAAAIAEAKEGGQKGLASVLKRVHTLVDQRDTERNLRLTAERELESAQAELQEAAKGNGARPAAAASNDPIEGHQAVVALRTQLNEMKAYLAWTDANPEGGTMPDGKGGEVEFSAAQVRQMRQNADEKRTELVSELTQTKAAVKQQFHAVQQQSDAVAVKLYPWLAQKENPSYLRVQQMLKALPALAAFPDAKLILGRYERGRLAEEAELKAKKLAPKTAPKQPAKVVATAGTVTTERRKAGAQDGDEVKQTQKQFEGSGRFGDMAKQFAAERRAKTARR